MPTLALAHLPAAKPSSICAAWGETVAACDGPVRTAGCGPATTAPPPSQTPGRQVCEPDVRARRATQCMRCAGHACTLLMRLQYAHTRRIITCLCPPCTCHARARGLVHGHAYAPPCPYLPSVRHLCLSGHATRPATGKQKAESRREGQRCTHRSMSARPTTHAKRASIWGVGTITEGATHPGDAAPRLCVVAP